MTATMRHMVVDKITLNFGAGRDQKKLDKGIQLIEMITGIAPVKTVTQKRIPGWGLRPGLPVGAKLTLRGEKATEVLKRLLSARENKLPDSCFDDYGNVSFGIPEYTEIPDTKYDPKIGIIGLQVSVTLTRPGYRVARRHVRTSSVGHKHRVTGDDAKTFMKDSFGVEIQ